MDFESKRHLIPVSKSCVSQTPLPMSPDPKTFVHPPVSNFPPTAIIIVGMFAISFLFLCYYIFVFKCCLNWNRVHLVRIRRFSISRRHEEQSMASENRGLEEAVIQSIPVIHYKAERDYGERSFCECAVCLNEFQEDEKLRVIPNCSHVFHIDCVDVWLQNNANCPLCRRHVSLTRQTQVDDQLLTPRPSPQDQSQNVENLIGGDEEFVVIDLDNNEHGGGQNLEERGKELEVPIGTIKERKLHKVASFGDECVGITNRDKDDDGFLSVQHIRRSFSMDLSVHVNEVSSIEVCGDSSRKAKRSFFSFGHGNRSKSVVLPIHLDP